MAHATGAGSAFAGGAGGGEPRPVAGDGSVWVPAEDALPWSPSQVTRSVPATHPRFTVQQALPSGTRDGAGNPRSYIRRRAQHVAPPCLGPRSFAGDAVFGHHVCTYGQPTSVAHWQLRDLLAYSEDSGGRPHLFTVAGCTTVAFDIAAQRSQRLQLLAFNPTSMTVGEGFIAAGGALGQVEVRALDDTASFKGNTRGSVNNALHIRRDANGKAVLFVANNDRTIKVHTLPDLERTAVVATPTPINYQALHSDATRLAAVGDTPSLYLYKAAEAGWRLSDTLDAATDAGMCCAWSPAGDSLAACYQDGTVCLWDSRCMQVTATLQMAVAARCVKFSEGPSDLLAIAEHSSAVHLVDLRNVAAVQTLPLDPPGARPHSLSGLAFSPAGQQLYVGLEGSGIARIDIDTLSRRTFSSGALA